MSVVLLSNVTKEYPGSPPVRALDGIDLVVDEGEYVAIARAIVSEPSLVLADEPTGNLDSHTGAEIMSAFHDLHRAGSTIVLITHDPALAALPRCVSLLDGRIVDDREPAPVAVAG